MTCRHRAAFRRGASAVFVLLLASAGAPRPARAWGDEGHEIVALIAAHELTGTARRRVEALLSTDRSGLVRDDRIAAESTWADRYRDSGRGRGGSRRRRTSRWHFADIELRSPDLAAACYGEPALPPGVPASRGPARDCVVDKVVQFDRELRAADTPPTERLRALQFLLHLVGDLHQPLHCADDHDRGGNARRVIGPDGRRSNLHREWDTVFVAGLGRSPAQVAAALVQRITPAERRRWRRGLPADWALETHAVAVQVAYGDLPRPDARGRERLDARYAAAASAAVRVQLERAGVRLAAMLNADLGY